MEKKKEQPCSKQKKNIVKINEQLTNKSIKSRKTNQHNSPTLGKNQNNPPKQGTNTVNNNRIKENKKKKPVNRGNNKHNPKNGKQKRL